MVPMPFDPARKIPIGDDSPKIVVVVFGANMELEQTSVLAAEPYFVAALHRNAPLIQLEENGTWKKHDIPDDDLEMTQYVGPSALVDCSPGELQSPKIVSSRYFIQVVGYSCSDGPLQLRFFGLGNYASWLESDGKDHSAKLIIQDPGLLALDFEVSRYLVSIVQEEP
jgi:hypothetical protein